MQLEPRIARKTIVVEQVPDVFWKIFRNTCTNREYKVSSAVYEALVDWCAKKTEGGETFESAAVFQALYYREDIGRNVGRGTDSDASEAEELANGVSQASEAEE
jgi:hypothetical protein